MNRIILSLVLLTNPVWAGAKPKLSTIPVQAHLVKSEMVDGTMNRVEITGPKGLSLKGRFNNTEFAVIEIPTEGAESTYFSLFAIPYDTPPGEKNYEIVWNESDTEKKLLLPFVLKSGNYPHETLSVDPAKVTPPKSELPRIAREQEELNRVYSSSSHQRLWKSAFALPMSSEITSRYGTKRVYNGHMKSFHAGTDFRAPVGTPILAPTEGKVVLAKDLYFSGGTVILDHGLGLYSMYFHMSKMEVKPGDLILPGNQLGLSGKSGRVSGPHLHWTIQLGRVKVNALDAMDVLR